MGLSKLANKLADYNDRLDRGQAEKIKPDHVSKVLHKLQRKVAELEADIAGERKPDKRERLERKLEVAREHVERAEWLQREIS